MGIFFDQDWFDERLKAAGQTRAALAAAAGMTVDEIDLVFRDLREIGEGEVRAFARVLSADPQEIATRSGLSSIGGANYSGATAHPPASAQMSAFAAPQAFSTSPVRNAPRQEFQVTREVISGLHERMDRLERLLELVIRKLDRPN